MPAPTTSLLALARPFLWLAVVAFIVGFAASVAPGHSIAAAHHMLATDISSGPSSAEWNLPKKI